MDNVSIGAPLVGAPHPRIPNQDLSLHSPNVDDPENDDAGGLAPEDGGRHKTYPYRPARCLPCLFATRPENNPVRKNARTDSENFASKELH